MSHVTDESNASCKSCKDISRLHFKHNTFIGLRAALVHWLADAIAAKPAIFTAPVDLWKEVLKGNNKCESPRTIEAFRRLGDFKSGKEETRKSPVAAGLIRRISLESPVALFAGWALLQIREVA